MEGSIVIRLQKLLRGRLLRQKLYAEMRALLQAEGLESLLEAEPEKGSNDDPTSDVCGCAEGEGRGESPDKSIEEYDDEKELTVPNSQSGQSTEGRLDLVRNIIMQEIEKRRNREEELERESTPEITDVERRRFDYLSTVSDVYIGNLRESSLLCDESAYCAHLPTWGRVESDEDDEDYRVGGTVLRRNERQRSPPTDREWSANPNSNPSTMIVRTERRIELPEVAVAARGTRENPGLGDERLGVRSLSPNRTSRFKGGWREALAEQRRSELSRFREEIAMLRSEGLSQRLDEESSRRERATASAENRMEVKMIQDSLSVRRREDVRDLKCHLAALRESSVRVRADGQAESRREVSNRNKAVRREERQSASLLASAARYADMAALRSIKATQKISPDQRKHRAANFTDSCDPLDDMRQGPIDLDAYNTSIDALEVSEEKNEHFFGSSDEGGGGAPTVNIAMIPVPPPLSPSRQISSPSRQVKHKASMRCVPVGVELKTEGGFLNTRPLTSSKP